MNCFKKRNVLNDSNKCSFIVACDNIDLISMVIREYLFEPLSVRRLK